MSADEAAVVTACRVCNAPIAAGDVAYAEDWKVMDDESPSGVRVEVRYVCEPCDAALGRTE